MNNQELRKKKIDLIVRNLNRELKLAADAKITVDLEVADISKPSDKIKRIRVYVLEENPNGSSLTPLRETINRNKALSKTDKRLVGSPFK